MLDKRTYIYPEKQVDSFDLKKNDLFVSTCCSKMSAVCVHMCFAHGNIVFCLSSALRVECLLLVLSHVQKGSRGDYSNLSRVLGLLTPFTHNLWHKTSKKTHTEEHKLMHPERDSRGINKYGMLFGYKKKRNKLTCWRRPRLAGPWRSRPP